MSVWKLDEKLLILESLISPTKILLSSSKNIPLCVFLTVFSLFHLVMKHCLSCLIYYIKFQIKYFEGSRYSVFSLGFG